MEGEQSDVVEPQVAEASRENVAQDEVVPAENRVAESSVSEPQEAAPIEEEADEDALLADDAPGEPPSSQVSGGETAQAPASQVETVAASTSDEACMVRDFQPADIIISQAAEPSVDEDGLLLSDGEDAEIEVVAEMGMRSQVRPPAPGLGRREPGVGAEAEQATVRSTGTIPRSPRPPPSRRSIVQSPELMVIEEVAAEESSAMEVEEHLPAPREQAPAAASEACAAETALADMRRRIDEIIAETNRAKELIAAQQEAELAQQRRQQADGVVELPVFTELNPPPGGWPASRRSQDEACSENWDDDDDVARSQPVIPASQSGTTRRSRRSRRRRRRRYNPNRQLTLDDLESVVTTESLSPEPGPPTSSGGSSYYSPSRGLPPPPGRRQLGAEEAAVAARSTAPRHEEPPRPAARAAENAGTERRRRAPRSFPVKLRGVMFGDLVAIPTNPTIDPPPFCCFNCWQRGHRVSECPRPQQQVFCRNCGRRGQDLSSCPRCSEPHRRFIEQTFTHEREIERRIEQENQEALREEAERRKRAEEAERRRAEEAARANAEQRRREIRDGRQSQRREEVDLSNRLANRLEEARRRRAPARNGSTNGEVVSGAREDTPAVGAIPTIPSRTIRPRRLVTHPESQTSNGGAPVDVPAVPAHPGIIPEAAATRNTLRVLEEMRALLTEIKEAVVRAAPQ